MNLSIIDRLVHIRTINPDTGCWEPTLKTDKNGYISTKVNGKQILLHRLSYETLVGPIPKGLCVCHKCDNRKCFNPEHLFLGTHQDNVNDMVEKGRYVAPKPEKILTNEQEKQIANDTRLQSTIAKDFGVSQTMVSRIQLNHGKKRGRRGPRKVGSDHGRALVNEQNVIAIRKSNEPTEALAKKYGVSQSTITAIKLRYNWKHVP